MKFVVLTILVLQSLFLTAQSGRLPANLLDASLVLGMQCAESNYNKNIQYVLSQLDLMDIQVKHKFYMHENPQLRNEDIKQANQLIAEGSFQYFMNVSLIFNSMNNSYLWVLSITPVDEQGGLDLYGKQYSRFKGYSLQKLLEKFSRSISKLKKRE